MAKDTYKTDVIFRVCTLKAFRGEVMALFPHEISSLDGSVTFYVHIGQHGSADYNYCIKTSRLASIEECKELKEELLNIGYDLNVIKKRNYNKYLSEYKRIRGIK